MLDCAPSLSARLRSDLERLSLELVRAAAIPEPSTEVIVGGKLLDFGWRRTRRQG